MDLLGFFDNSFDDQAFWSPVSLENDFSSVDPTGVPNEAITDPRGPGIDPIFSPAGSIIYGPCGYGTVSGTGSSYLAAIQEAPDPDPDEIVVTGTPMTDEQRSAYDMAYNRAWWDVTVGELIGFGGLAFTGQWGALASATLATLDNRLQLGESATVALAEIYYDYDGADGTFDGVNDYDRAMTDLGIRP